MRRLNSESRRGRLGADSIVATRYLRPVHRRTLLQVQAVPAPDCTLPPAQVPGSHLPTAVARRLQLARAELSWSGGARDPRLDNRSAPALRSATRSKQCASNW